jgi:hypothetical protein
MMNERIKELALQAEEYALRECDNNGHFHQIYREKFAELIVRECAQLLFAESERLYSYSSECDIMRDSDEAELCAEKCMDNIKMIEEHFYGVGE